MYHTHQVACHNPLARQAPSPLQGERLAQVGRKTTRLEKSYQGKLNKGFGTDRNIEMCIIDIFYKFMTCPIVTHY